jgi:predicted membrane protein
MQWRREIRWNAHDLGWRVGALFVVGAFLFALGSFPPYAQLVDPGVDAGTFALGSVFFTSAGYSQFLQALNDGSSSFRYIGVKPLDLIWWAAAVQLAGTIFFNISAFGALVDGLETYQEDRLVWAPDMYGSVAFLIASTLAWTALVGFRWAVRREDTDWWINLLNAIGSIFFMMSALGAFILPTTGDARNIALVNSGTFVGSLCFLVGAYLLWPPRSPRTR